MYLVMKGSSMRIIAVAALALNLMAAGAAFARDGRDGGRGEDETKFTGAIQSLPGASSLVGDWVVDGRTVHVTSATRIEQEDGRVAVGAIVKVEGRQRSDNSIDAEEIEVRQAAPGGGGGGGVADVNFKGTIQSLPNTAGFIGDWVVGGTTIHVTSTTKIEAETGPVAVGAFVEVKGTQRNDGSIDATKIEVKSNVGGNDGRHELTGTVDRLPGTAGFVGDWTVSGRIVHVTSATVLNQEHGPIALGAMVEVQGTLRADGSIDATRIEVKANDNREGRKVNFKGTIQSMPVTGFVGDWTISGRTVHVTSSTNLKNEHGQFGVNVRVKVKGIELADGSVVATTIQVKD
jgi:hypothetical protein